MTLNLSQNSRYLLEILRAVVKSEPVPPPPSGVDMERVFEMADHHSLAPLVYHGLYPLGLDEKDIAPFAASHRQNLARSVMQEREGRRIFAALDSAGVDHCPLKGWFTRELYPDPLMRLMTDVDILIRPDSQLESKRIMEELGYTCLRFRSAEDDKYRLSTQIVEFHTGLDSDGLADADYYADPWRLTEKTSSHGHRLRNEDEYLYAIAHALKHFMYSGVGIRTLADIYLYLAKEKLDREYVLREAEKMGFTRFLSLMESTALAAFGEEEFSEDTAEVFRFMLECGTNGTAVNTETSQMLRSGISRRAGSKTSLLIRHIFPPLKEMTYREPVLREHKWLLPIMHVKRWGQLIFTKRERLDRGLERIGSIDMEHAKRLRRLHEIAGIKDDRTV